MDRIEEKPLPTPVAAVPGDQLVFEDQLHVIDRRNHRDRPMGVLHWNAVAVGVEPNKRQRVGMRLRDPPGLTLLCRERQEGGPLLLQEQGLRAILAP